MGKIKTIKAMMINQNKKKYKKKMKRKAPRTKIHKIQKPMKILLLIIIMKISQESLQIKDPYKI